MLSVFSSIEPRLDGEEYYEFVDEFMAAVKLRWPRALSKLISRKKLIFQFCYFLNMHLFFTVQHEDFQTKHAVNLLKRYRSSYLMFNDDIQGTAATTLAGVYGALKVKFA